MAFGRKQIPVFLFTGFLESGKTTFIQETLMEGQFKDGRTTLLILCEEGEIELPEPLLKENKFLVETIDDEEEVTAEKFKEWDKKYKPHRVMIEANGMWSADELIEAFPDNWLITEEICTVDSTTFDAYLANMKMMMTNQFKDSDLVVFNRCTENHDRAMFKRMVRAVNRRAQVLFETPEGEVDNDAHEEPPYDVNAEVIEVTDEDFGIFYLDALDNEDTFKEKKVSLKGQVYHPKGAKSDAFVVGRYAMTCCADDVAFVGFPCKWDEASFLKAKDWITVKARIGYAPAGRNEAGEIERAPVFFAESIAPAEPAEEEIVYFN